MSAEFQSLGLRSDSYVMTGLCEVEDHGDLIVMRTPSEPGYWYGNVIAYKRPPADALADVLAFPRHFPDAKHVQVMWDVPGLPLDPIRAALSPFGYTVEGVDVLASRKALRAVAVPQGIAFREMSSDADWSALFDFQMEIAAGDAMDESIFRPFLERRQAARRRQIAGGLGTWFGAFDGDQLVCHMGMFIRNGLARYQSVETRSSHRKRGIASALLVHAHDWAKAEDPDAEVVIVADAGSAGGRLYRAMGFEVAEVLVEAYRHPV